PHSHPHRLRAAASVPCLSPRVRDPSSPYQFRSQRDVSRNLTPPGNHAPAYCGLDALESELRLSFAPKAVRVRESNMMLWASPCPPLVRSVCPIASSSLIASGTRAFRSYV